MVKFLVVLFDAFLIPCFVEAIFLQSGKTPLQNGYLRLFAANIYLDDAENQSLLCAEIICRGLAWETVTLCIGVKLVVNKAGICIQKLSFCIQQTFFTF